MSKRLGSRLCGRVTGVVAGFLMLSLPISVAASWEQGSFNSLTLTLEATRSSVALLEPVPLTITLSNQTTTNALAHRAIGFLGGRIRLEVTPQGGATQFLNRLAHRRVVTHVFPRVMKPGERYSSTELLLQGLAETLGIPGQYEVRAALNGPASGDTIWSNPITLHVSEPQGRNREAYEYILDSGRKHSFFSSPMPDSGHVEQLKRFVALYQDTVYGSYAVFALGAFYADKGQPATARSYFTQIADERIFREWSEAIRYLRRHTPRR